MALDSFQWPDLVSMSLDHNRHNQQQHQHQHEEPLHIQIFIPIDLKSRFRSNNVVLLGYKMSNILIIFDLKSKDVKLPSAEFPGLQEIGTLNCNSSNSSNSNSSNSTSESSQMLNLHVDTKTGDIKCGRTATIIYFNPPNFTNLEYFSIEPILLQSMGPIGRKSKVLSLSLKMEEYYKPHFDSQSVQMCISNDTVLEKINQIYRTRLKYREPTSMLPFARTIKSFVKPAIIYWLVPFIQIFQKVLILFIDIINYDVYSYSLVKMSKVCRQLDLRLKQLNYFPIQFLCYYNKSILYQENNSLIVHDLKLPIFNSNLNINNSNYINLYNSIWLIFNDILIGITIHSIIANNQYRIFDFIQSSLLEKYLFSDMVSLINWVSTKHPAGFKLNTDLGRFLGDLYVWTVVFWKSMMDKLQLTENRNLILCIVRILSTFGGCSFLISFVLDIINILTFHIYAFYYCAAKVYKRQVLVIKSLFQLFRGKKYNVLRQRIDNLNNYEEESCADGFEVDQLLVGTLLFMIMILLLPTVFAFYITFSTLHISTLMVHNLLENLQIVLNFTPIFVCLLKLKNSRRLQGGITFEFVKYNKESKVTEVCMSNKSLTYTEIFVNFVTLTKRAKNFRDSIIWNFISGDIILIRYDHSLKFLYLMLPEEYRETINVWKYI
ncbi:gpi1 [Candida oxycetoniae]|uniref:Gpi1 n=1 Tax=Candida oxycetoniae TaxID=497107 RepID=A0AAI9SWQ5_9ASCO|nr:gpi1 [Candida oxycetoniae]KAI3404269.2 gpi1 [Candida oxycetoniae]